MDWKLKKLSFPRFSEDGPRSLRVIVRSVFIPHEHGGGPLVEVNSGQSLKYSPHTWGWYFPNWRDSRLTVEKTGIESIQVGRGKYMLNRRMIVCPEGK